MDQIYVTKSELKELIEVVRNGFATTNERLDQIDTVLKEQNEYYGRRDEEFRLSFEGIDAMLEQIWRKIDDLEK